MVVYSMFRRVIIAALALALFASSAFAISFDTLRSNLDTQNNSRVYVKQYWKDVKGKSVTWKGRVVDVRSSALRHQYKVMVRVDDSALDANVILVVKDQPSVAKLKNGHVISFSGTLHDFSWSSGQHIKQLFKDEEWVRDIVVVLDNVRVK
jgi:hypothetical protein